MGWECGQAKRAESGYSRVRSNRGDEDGRERKGSGYKREWEVHRVVLEKWLKESQCWGRVRLQNAC